MPREKLSAQYKLAKAKEQLNKFLCENDLDEIIERKNLFRNAKRKKEIKIASDLSKANNAFLFYYRLTTKIKKLQGICDSSSPIPSTNNERVQIM